LFGMDTKIKEYFVLKTGKKCNVAAL